MDSEKLRTLYRAGRTPEQLAAQFHLRLEDVLAIVHDARRLGVRKGYDLKISATSRGQDQPAQTHAVPDEQAPQE